VRGFEDLESILPTCLRKAFTYEDPKSAKRQSSHQCLFALLGSMHAKAARKMLVKSSSERGFQDLISEYELDYWYFKEKLTLRINFEEQI